MFKSALETLIADIKDWHLARQPRHQFRKVEASFTRAHDFIESEGLVSWHSHVSGLYNPNPSAHQTLAIETAKAKAEASFRTFVTAVETIPHLKGVGVQLILHMDHANPKARVTLGGTNLMDAPRTGHVWTNVAKRLELLKTKSLLLEKRCGTPKGYWSFISDEGQVRASSAGEALVALALVKTGGVKKNSLYCPQPCELAPRGAAMADFNALMTTL